MLPRCRGYLQHCLSCERCHVDMLHLSSRHRRGFDQGKPGKCRAGAPHNTLTFPGLKHSCACQDLPASAADTLLWEDKHELRRAECAHNTVRSRVMGSPLTCGATLCPAAADWPPPFPKDPWNKA